MIKMISERFVNRWFFDFWEISHFYFFWGTGLWSIIWGYFRVFWGILPIFGRFLAKNRLFSDFEIFKGKMAKIFLSIILLFWCLVFFKRLLMGIRHIVAPCSFFGRNLAVKKLSVKNLEKNFLLDHEIFWSSKKFLVKSWYLSKSAKIGKNYFSKFSKFSMIFFDFGIFHWIFTKYWVFWPNLPKFLIFQANFRLIFFSILI